MEDDPATPSRTKDICSRPHYDRHVWLYRENPKGIYEQFNANVQLRGAQGGSPGPHGAGDRS